MGLCLWIQHPAQKKTCNGHLTSNAVSQFFICVLRTNVWTIYLVISSMVQHPIRVPEAPLASPLAPRSSSPSWMTNDRERTWQGTTMVKTWVLCISTSFRMLHEPESWSKHFFQLFSTFFVNFINWFAPFTQLLRSTTNFWEAFCGAKVQCGCKGSA